MGWLPRFVGGGTLVARQEQTRPVHTSEAATSAVGARASVTEGREGTEVGTSLSLGPFVRATGNQATNCSY